MPATDIHRVEQPMAELGAHLGAEELFVQYAPFVAKFLARLGVAHQDIPDAVQEVFLVVHAQGGYTPRSARPTTWLASIAVHIAQSARRANRKRQLAVQETVIEEAPAKATSPLDAAMASQQLKQL